MLSRDNKGALSWQFDEQVSAAGWIDHTHLLIASESKLFQFNIDLSIQRKICSLEKGNLLTRSNDGRADPWGGFWIGTMGKRAEPGAGGIYRFYKGKIKKLVSKVTIPNSICFSQDKKHAFYSDTATKLIMKQTLDHDGWPEGDSTIFINMKQDGLNPDGAIVDSQGQLWNAQWGASRVSYYSPNGKLLDSIKLPVLLPTCPAFGGSDYKDLFVTSATENLVYPTKFDGTVQMIKTKFKGQPEHRIIL